MRWREGPEKDYKNNAKSALFSFEYLPNNSQFYPKIDSKSSKRNSLRCSPSRTPWRRRLDLSDCCDESGQHFHLYLGGGDKRREGGGKATQATNERCLVASFDFSSLPRVHAISGVAPFLSLRSGGSIPSPGAPQSPPPLFSSTSLGRRAYAVVESRRSSYSPKTHFPALVRYVRPTERARRKKQLLWVDPYFTNDARLF